MNEAFVVLGLDHYAAFFMPRLLYNVVVPTIAVDR